MERLGLRGQPVLLVRAVSPGPRVCTVIPGRPEPRVILDQPEQLVYPASKVTKAIKETTELQVRSDQRARKVMSERSVWPDPQEPRVILARQVPKETQASAVQWGRSVQLAPRVTPVRLAQQVPKGLMVRPA